MWRRDWCGGAPLSCCSNQMCCLLLECARQSTPLSNDLSHSLQLKMWVEKGKEDEARKEKEKVLAPPTMAASASASSFASGATGSEASGPPPPVL